MINLEKQTNTSYKVLFNTKYLGMAEMGVDGFYNFYADDSNKGYWSSYSLRLIADKLDELNKEWSDYIKENLK